MQVCVLTPTSAKSLMQVKDRLELFVRSDRSQMDDLAALAPGYEADCRYPGMLGLGQPRRVLRIQIWQVEHLHAGAPMVSDASLEGCGGRPGCMWKAALQGISWPGTPLTMAAAGQRYATRLAQLRYDRCHQQLFRKRATPGMTREDVKRLIASQWDHAQLKPRRRPAQQCCAGVSHAALERCGSHVGSCLSSVHQAIVARAPRPVA